MLFENNINILIFWWGLDKSPMEVKKFVAVEKVLFGKNSCQKRILKKKKILTRYGRTKFKV